MLFAIGKRQERLQMIEQALKDKAPRMYRQLKTGKKLNQFLSDHEEAMMQSFQEATVEAWHKIAGQRLEDPNEAIQKGHMTRNEAWNDTLATWLEFSDPTSETTESYQAQ